MKKKKKDVRGILVGSHMANAMNISLNSKMCSFWKMFIYILKYHIWYSKNPWCTLK